MIELAIELLLLIPPFDAVQSWSLPPLVPEITCFVGVMVFVLAVSRPTSRAREGSGQSMVPPLFEGHPIRFAIVIVIVMLLGLRGMTWATWTAIFHTGYAAMVLSVRFAEGVAIGTVVKKAPGIMAFVLVGLAVAVAAYLTVGNLPAKSVAIAKTVWIGVTTVLASAAAARTLTKGAPHLSPELVGLGAFLMFSSTMLYVSSEPGLGITYSLLYLGGVLIGLVSPQIERLRQYLRTKVKP